MGETRRSDEQEKETNRGKVRAKKGSAGRTGDTEGENGGSSLAPPNETKGIDHTGKAQKKVKTDPRDQESVKRKTTRRDLQISEWRGERERAEENAMGT